jgi:transposase InsO family protein
VHQVAQELGLTASALRNWVKKAEIDQNPSATSELTSPERKELIALRKEPKRVEMETILLNCNFLAIEPDRSWVADTTYIWTSQDSLYSTVVINLFSHRVVGCSMAEHMRTDLVLTALQASLRQRRLVFHNDRGSQYASVDYPVGTPSCEHHLQHEPEKELLRRASDR